MTVAQKTVSITVYQSICTGVITGCGGLGVFLSAPPPHRVVMAARYGECARVALTSIKGSSTAFLNLNTVPSLTAFLLWK